MKAVIHGFWDFREMSKKLNGDCMLSLTTFFILKRSFMLFRDHSASLSILFPTIMNFWALKMTMGNSQNDANKPLILAVVY